MFLWHNQLSQFIFVTTFRLIKDMSFLTNHCNLTYISYNIFLEILIMNRLNMLILPTTKSIDNFPKQQLILIDRTQ